MDNEQKKQMEINRQYHEKIRNENKERIRYTLEQIRKENEEENKRLNQAFEEDRRISKIRTILTVIAILGYLILFVMVMPTEEPGIHGELYEYSKFEYITRSFLLFIISLVFILTVDYIWRKNY